jgi:asparagine synthase (glutamine-hydrolysing)
VGEFALVREDGDEVAAAVDPVRSRPLFYAIGENRVLVSDRPQWLARSLDQATFDPVAEFEFLQAGIVSGRDTLYEEIKALQAGEVVEIDATHRPISLERQNHFEYIPAGNARSATELLDELDAVLERVVDRLLDVAAGRQIAISLSGGYDSVLVACLLARRNHPKVTSFSFGRQGNPDAAISQRVAGELGLPWSFVEYTNERWRGWYRSTDRREYFASAFDYSSVPSIGTCPALDELADRGVLADDALLVSGDSITTTGEHVPARFVDAGPGALDRSDVVDEIYDLQYTLWGHTPAETELVRERIAERLGDPVIPDDSPAAALQAWDWRERQSKFIVSPEEYDYGGYDSWLPLFDREYMAFWKTVPLARRAGRTLHEAYVDELFAAQSKSGEAITAERSGYGTVGQLKQLVAASPIARVAEPLYRNVTGESNYTSDLLSGFGIVPEQLFRRLYTGTQSVHSFVALDLMGRVSLVPPVSRVPPEDGVVTLNPNDAHALRETRRELPWF